MQYFTQAYQPSHITLNKIEPGAALRACRTQRWSCTARRHVGASKDRCVTLKQGEMRYAKRRCAACVRILAGRPWMKVARDVQKTLTE
jgi:hypothetical protein